MEATSQSPPPGCPGARRRLNRERDAEVRRRRGSSEGGVPVSAEDILRPHAVRRERTVFLCRRRTKAPHAFLPGPFWCDARRRAGRSPRLHGGGGGHAVVSAGTFGVCYREREETAKHNRQLQTHTHARTHTHAAGDRGPGRGDGPPRREPWRAGSGGLGPGLYRLQSREPAQDRRAGSECT
jgi:hypothetical protein